MVPKMDRALADLEERAMRQITRPVLFLRQRAGADYLLAGCGSSTRLNQLDSASNKSTVDLYEYLNANEGQDLCGLIASL